MISEAKKNRKRFIHSVIGGAFLIGLAILFYFDALWPWILALVGIVVIIEAFEHL
jgi:hypothetical protein